MLKPATLYKEELSKRMQNTWFDEKYKYYHIDYQDNVDILDNTWNKIQMVSIFDDKIIGYFEVIINRQTMNTSGFCAINFSDNKIIFGKDLYRFLFYLLDTIKVNKIKFSVVIGNPIEPSYDKLSLKYGGKVVGLREKEVLINNEYHDLKLYEILRENYEKIIIKKVWDEKPYK